MATAPDQNLSDAASSLGRSSSIDARDGALPRSDSQRRSASKVGRKGGRSGNDLFVCFAPRTTLNLVTANRPVVSPARDKGKEAVGSARRSSRTLSSSIFSNKGAPKKQGYDAVEEPTSPKVTCIGQVRSKSKNDKRNKGSPGGARKQAEGKKESACSSFAKDFSCFGLPCDSYGSLPSFRGDKKSNGTVFAKSLVLIQREDEAKSVAMETSGMQLRTQSSPEREQSKGEGKSVLGKVGFAEEESREDASSRASVTESVIGAHDKPQTLQSMEIAEDQTSVEEDDTFETEPPPSNALLLMRNKVEHLRVLVPPPSINITLKRSTSAPVHCRRKSEDADDGSQVCAAPDDADHLSSSERKTAMETRRETSSVLISTEDLPKPAGNASKSFLQRCKSVSRSLSRSSGEPTEDAKASPATQDTKVGNDACDMAVISEHKDELHLVSEALSRRRSDSEALKVSLDIVPETWLWEARAVARQEPKEKTGSGRRLEMKQGGGAVAEWWDGELEAALWKSCQVSEPRPSALHVHKEPTRAAEPLPSSLPDTNLTANHALDAEVEATLWRCCSLVASQGLHDPQSELKMGELGLVTSQCELESGEIDPETADTSSKSKDEAVAGGDKIVEHATKSGKQGHAAADSGRKSTAFGRSCSVGSQSSKHLLERGISLRRCASVGTGQQQQQERGKTEKKKKKKPSDPTREEKTATSHGSQDVSAEGHARTCQSNVGDLNAGGHVQDEHNTVDVRDVSALQGDVGITAGVASSEGYASSCIVEAELWCGSRPSGNCPNRMEGSIFDNGDTTESNTCIRTDGEESTNSNTATASSVLDRPAPPPSPAPATPPEAVLVLRYDLGAFRISLDATAKAETQADQQQQQQQKAMLEAISHLHIHDVQRTYTRLLKAASGKERASLSTAAFRLQRCKSEPVRLASY